MENKKLSPVEQFYSDLEEERRLAAIEALKTKRGRPRKNKLYFTISMEIFGAFTCGAVPGSVPLSSSGY